MHLDLTIHLAKHSAPHGLHKPGLHYFAGDGLHCVGQSLLPQSLMQKMLQSPLRAMQHWSKSGCVL